MVLIVEIPGSGPFKSRPIPYAMRAKVDAEFNRLLAQEIIEPIKHAEWALGSASGPCIKI